MDSSLPVFTQGACLSIEYLEKLAADRQLPLGTEQRRDSEGKYQSHHDLPDTKKLDN